MNPSSSTNRPRRSEVLGAIAIHHGNLPPELHLLLLVPRRLKARPRADVLHVPPQAREARSVAQLREGRAAVLEGVLAHVVGEEHEDAHEEGGGGHVGDRPAAHRERPVSLSGTRARISLRTGRVWVCSGGQRREEGLERVEGVEELSAGGGAEEEVDEGVREDAGLECVHEKPRAGTQDGICGEEGCGGAEVCEELEEDEGLGELDGLGRGLVGGYGGATIGDCGDLGR